jgi:hypothetical protein
VKGNGDLRVTYDDKLLYTVPETCIFDEECRKSIGGGYFYAKCKKAIRFKRSIPTDHVLCSPLRLEAVVDDMPPYTDLSANIEDPFEDLLELSKQVYPATGYVGSLVDLMQERKRTIEKHVEGLESFAPPSKIQKK